MPHSALKKCHIVAVAPLKEGWDARQVKAWVENAGGRITFQPKVNEQTTHVVVGEKKWRQQDDFVLNVLEYKKETGQHIDVVDYAWLDESLIKKTKKRESSHSWEKNDKIIMEARRRADKEQAKLEKARNPRTTSGLMKEVFTDSTDAYVDEKEKRRVERRMIEEEKLRKEAEEEKKKEAERIREQMRVKEVAAVFRRTVQKSRNELLSDNHHIYMDDTGFHYDVLVTKVDTRNNRNERYALTIYESNEQPETYAVNCQFAGTKRIPENNVIASIGSNFHTAFSAFKKIFKEKTLVDWDNRVNAAIENRKREMRDRGQGTGSPTGSVRGKPVGKDKVRAEPEDFNKMPFQYHPPLYGPRGTFPKANDPQNKADFDPPRDAAEGPSQKQQPSPVHIANGEYLMRGGNGESPPSIDHDSGRQSAPIVDESLEQAMKEDKAREDALGDSPFAEPFDYGRSEGFSTVDGTIDIEKEPSNAGSGSEASQKQKRKAASSSVETSSKKAKTGASDHFDVDLQSSLEFDYDADRVWHGDPRDDTLIDSEEAERDAEMELAETSKKVQA